MRLSFFFIINLLLGFCVWVFSDIADHFKKAEGKSQIHSMKNIDFVYMINLDERPEKMARSLEQLAPYGIVPYRFSAVNGWKLSLDTLNDVGLKVDSTMKINKILGNFFLSENQEFPFHEKIDKIGRVYFVYNMNRGAIGCVLSHLSILQDAYDSGFETIWVMEDDIEVIRDPNLMSEYVEKLDQAVGKGNWDVLFTDTDTKDAQGNRVQCLSYLERPNYELPSRIVWKISSNYRQNVGECFQKIHSRFGTYSMIVRRPGMKKILDFIKTYKVFLPYDIDFCLPEKIRLYVVREDVVSTNPRASSDNDWSSYEKNL